MYNIWVTEYIDIKFELNRQIVLHQNYSSLHCQLSSAWERVSSQVQQDKILSVFNIFQ